jgi:hypothetical protein
MTTRILISIILISFDKKKIEDYVVYSSYIELFY